MFSNIIAGAAGFPVADLGDEISQSLRFRSDTGPSLSRTMGTGDSRKKFTVSAWVKRSKIPGADQNHLWNYEDNPNVCALVFWNNKLRFYHYDSGGTFNAQYKTTAVFRDTSAWYHVVAAIDTTLATATDRIKLWVNGVRITAFDETNTFSQDYDTFVGLNNYTSLIGKYADGSSFKLGGYVANKHFLDGIAASETDFGRYQEDGVWVPKNYTGSYGTNGYHLDFANKSDLGNDVSGNNNDFTASGFDTALIGIWTEQLFSSTKSTIDFTSTSTAYNSANYAFDGNLSFATQTNATTDSSLIFRPTVPLTNVTQIRVYNDTSGMENGYNGANTVSAPGGWVTVYSGSAITVNNIFTQSDNRAKINAIEVNGTVLVDNTDNDVDYLDTPTSNYATLNPLNYALATMSNANLAFRSSGSGAWQFRPASVGGQSTGKWYWEARAVGSGSSLMASIINDQYEKVNTSDVYPGQGAGVGTGGWSLYGANGNLYRNGVDQVANSGSSYSTDDILMFALDLENGAWWAGQNGTWYQSATTSEIEAGTTTNAIDTGTLSGKFWPGFVTQGGTANGWDVNFGQMPFVYTQPSGFNAWQTNNLPEPEIKNGKEHFDVVTWSGDGTNGRDITGLEFQPDLVWIKCTNRALNHNLYDSVRGVTKHLTPNEPYANITTANSLTAFNSDGFQVGFGASDNTSSPASDYVAWCWKAGGTAVSNTDGDITSSVRANTDAGFSIVGYASQGGNINVGHGLNSAPEFMIVKARDHSMNWAVYHKDAGNTGLLFLNTTAAFTTSAGAWNNTTPTNQVFRVGGTSYTNGSGSEQGDYIAYCWHSVEGFSKFGSFSGNSSADGSFVYLGFRPSLIIWKRSDSAADWQMRDIQRDQNVNPVNLTLYPNLSSDEYTGASADVDFLSNGFKMRTSDTNVNGGTMLYMAWAENPFGGENAAPATAR